MDRKTSVGRGALTVLGGLLIFVLAFGALAGCGSSGNEGNNNVPSNTPNNSVPGNTPNPTAQSTVTQPPAGGTTSGETTSGGNNVVVRVSGAQGTEFSGTYGTAQDVRVADGTVGTGPTDYPVTGASDVVTATFKKTQPGTDLLEVSILDGGEVVTGSQTYAEFGSVTVNWSPREETQGGTTLPGGAGSDRSQP